MEKSINLKKIVFFGKKYKGSIEKKGSNVTRSSFKVLLEEERIFVNSDCLQKEIMEKYLFYT